MTENLSLGKKGKSGEIDFSKIRSGIKKKELLEGVDPKLKSVFEQIINKIDTNPDDNMLSREELQSFYEELEKLSKGDRNLSSREGRKYQLNGENIGRKGKDALFALLNKLTDLSKDVKEISRETVNGQEVEVIKYNDNRTERIFPDGSRIITVVNGKKTVSTSYDKDEKRREESVTEGDGTVTTSYAEDGETKTKEVFTNNKDNDRTTVLYENNTPAKRIVETEGKTMNYTLVEINGKEEWQLQNQTENVNGEEQTTTYEYNKDGTKSAEIITTSGKRIERFYESNGTIVELIKTEGEPDHIVERDSEGNYTDKYMDRNADVTDSYDATNTHLGQTRVVGEHTYDVKYDENGNTVGVIVQNGESIQAIANKFGVSVKDLIKANASKVHGKYPNAYFQVGEEIKIPRKMEADERALQGRKSREEAVSDYSAMMERRAEEARQREHQAKLAERNIVVKGRNNYAVAKDGYGNIHFLNPQGEDITEEEFKQKCPTIYANQVKEQNRQNQEKIREGNNHYYVTIDGNGDLHFFAPNGKEISGVEFKEHCPSIYKEVCKKYGKEIEKTASEKQVLKNSAQQIVNDLIDAASGWNDLDKIKRTIAKIDTPEELEEVNRLLQQKGYKATDLHSSIEVFIRKEENHGVMRTDHSSDYLEQTVQKWINNGTLKGQAAIDAQARMAARVIFDGGDGFGTDCNKIKQGIRYIRCPKASGNKAADNAQAKAVYEKVNAILVKHRTFYGLGSPCKNLRDYCEGEMWESECRYLDGILAENNAIQGEQKAQAIHNLTEEAVAGAGTDIDYLKQAIRAINSREDRIAIEAKLREYCKEHNVKYQYEGQSPLQAILYDECDTFMGFSRDHKEIRKFNEMLIEQGAYNEQEIINIRAEQAALQILEGDYDNILDAVKQIKDPKVLEKVNQILTAKCKKSLFSYLETELNKTDVDLVKAELAANNVINGKAAADVAYRLILNSDFDKRAMGLRAIRNAEVAKIVDGYLKTKNSSLAKVVEQFNKEKAEYKSKARLWDGLAFILGDLAEGISDEYRENTDVSDNMYVEASTAQQLSEEKKAAYKMAVDTFEATLNKMKADYQQARDSHGLIDGAINAFCSRYNIGTTRDEIEARIEHDTETLRLLKLAADGKLTKFVDGKEVPVSFEEVWNERQSVVITGNMGMGKAQEVNFDAAKVEKVAQKAQTIVAMDFAKDNIAICWDELSNAKTAEELAAAITDTLEKLSIMSGQELSLDGLGYKLKDGVIIDNSGNPVPVPQLWIVVNQLKQGLSDISKSLFNVEIPKESNISSVNDILSKGYDSRMESFKQEFRDAFGQEVPDEMIENYLSTISKGKIGVDIVVAIGAIIAAVITGGGSLAAFAYTALGTFSVNALNNATDADGYTNEEWTGDAQQALWDGALAAIGFKVGQFAEGFARGSQIVSSQNKWISWLTKQPKGGLTNRLASIPRNQLGKVASKAKEVADKIQAYSGKIGKNVLEARKAQILAKNPGANLNSVERASVLFARAEACGLEVTSDMIQSLVQTYCMTGEFDEESFLMALCMSLGANVVGHSVAARHIEQTPPPAPKEKETGTETLDVASSHGTAHPSDVHVGTKKAETIKAEVEAAINKPDISGEELARIRSEVEALSDRDLRRELLAKIDEKAKTLEAPKQAAFNDARTEDLQNNVNHIFEKHSVLNPTDVRVLREYINSTDDINVLNELKAKLRQKELTYGGVTADYKTLYNTIDEKIRVLTPKPEMSNEEVKSYIYSILNSDKGMVKEEVEQLLDYIKGVQSADELKEISALVGKKKMIGSYKKQLKSAIDERANALRTADEAPKTDETPRTDEEVHGNENIQDENPTPDSSYSVRDENGAVIHIDTANGMPVKAHVGDKVYDIKDGKFTTDDGIVYEVNDSGIKRTKVNTNETPKSDNTAGIFTNAEKQSAADINKFLKDNNIECNSDIIKGNGSLSFEIDGTKYQLHYEDGKLTASRIRTSDGTKVYYRYYPDGNKVRIDRDEFLTLKESSDTKRNKVIEEMNSEHVDPNASSSQESGAKAYDQMNHEELFAEYYRLKMEVTYSPLSNSAKAANINEMKKISALIEQKGYKIEGDKLVKINDEAPKGKPDNSAEEGEAVHKPKFSATELRQKLGERLYKIYQKAEEMIKNLRTINDYNIAKTYIKAQFAKFNDVMTDLLESLEAAAKKLGILAKRTVFGETGSKYFSQRDVNNFINEKVESPRDLYNRMLAAGFESNRATHFSKTQAFISMYDPKGNNLYTYIYDGQGNLIHKSLCKATRHPDGSYTRHSDLIVEYNNGKATVNIEEGGKTIYSKHVTPQSSRRADRSSHIDPEKAKAYAKFDKNSPIHVLREGRTVDLDQNRQYLLDLNNLPQLTLLDGTVVDLNYTQIKNRIASLQEGEFITIGRDGDIRLNNAGNNVSRHHILITRHNGRIIMKDVSSNGKTKCYSGTSSHNSNRTGSYGSTNNAGARGRISEKAYMFNNINELRTQMRDVLERFSENTQKMILNNLSTKGNFRCQKNGIEYQFVRRGNTVRVEEFDIQKKYNIKETKIDDYTAQTTYDINDVNDIWWAMRDKLPRFSPEIQNTIITQLSNGKGFICSQDGIRYEFSIDNTGRITVKEFQTVRYNRDYTNRYNNGSTESSRQSYNGRKVEELSQEAQNTIRRAEALISEKENAIIGLEATINAYKSKKITSNLSDEVISRYKQILGIPDEAPLTPDTLKKAYRKKSMEAHPDRNGGTDEAMEKFKEIGNAYETLSQTLDSTKTNEQIQSDIDAYQKEIDKLTEEIQELQETIKKALASG